MAIRGELTLRGTVIGTAPYVTTAYFAEVDGGLAFDAGECTCPVGYDCNPAAETQAIDRAHRIGQTRPVIAYRMIARDTIEEKVGDLARRKAELFSGVMDDGDLFSGSLTADDIRGLLEEPARERRGLAGRALAAAA